jgi:hypothetical protein
VSAHRVRIRFCRGARRRWRCCPWYLAGGRQQRQLEREKWKQAQEDALAAAVVELTRHLAAASQEITWFTAEADLRKKRFGEESITNYDAAMKTHLTAVIEGLVAVAHRDPEAFRTLFGIAERVWELDIRVAKEASDYWSEPEAAKSRIANLKSDAVALEYDLPPQIVDVLGDSKRRGRSRG